MVFRKVLTAALTVGVMCVLPSCSDPSAPSEKTTEMPVSSDTSAEMTTASAPIASVRVTIGENQRIDDIVALLTASGLGSTEKYIDLLQNHDFGFRFEEKLKECSLSPDRKYLLEGYLLPGDYSFPANADEQTVLSEILSRFDSFFTDSCYDRAAELGLNMDEVITLASVVEIETADNRDCSMTASVFLNRLKSPDFPKLQSDRTVLYVLDGFTRSAANEDIRVDSPYNTYMYNGLMPSAVCNPTTEAIEGVLFADSSDYYYFINRHDGRNEYASTYAEHKANYKRYLDGEL